MCNLTSKEANIAVVMATFNGETYIEQQLRTILEGQVRPQKLLIGDDGSCDATLSIARRFEQAAPGVVETCRNQERLGATRNFFHLLRELPDGFEYVAFSDQDDVWKKNKLDRGLRLLADCDLTKPALYCSRQQLIDENDNEIRLSPDHSRPPLFPNALVQNIATGCTIIINKPLLELVRHHPAPDVKYHDWWLYLMATGSGGQVVFDSEPMIRYRQHQGNLVGSPASLWRDLAARTQRTLKSRSRCVTDKNLTALESVAGLLTPENQKLLAQMRDCRRRSLFGRAVCAWRLPTYRQTDIDTLIFRLLLIAGRL